MSDTQVVAFDNGVSAIVARVDAIKTPRQLTKQAKVLEDKGVSSFFELGGVLSRIKLAFKEKDPFYINKYGTWEDYLTAEHQISRATAQRWIDVYNALVTQKIPYEKVAMLPMSKLAAGLHAITADNVDAMVPKLLAATQAEIPHLAEVKAGKDPAKVAAGKAGGKSTSKPSAKAAPAVPAQTVEEDPVDPASEVTDVEHKEVTKAAPAAVVDDMVIPKYVALTEEQIAKWMDQKPISAIVDIYRKVKPALSVNANFKPDALPKDVATGIAKFLNVGKGGLFQQMVLINGIFSGNTTPLVRELLLKMTMQDALNLVDGAFPGKFMCIYDTQEESDVADAAVEAFRVSQTGSAE
jgi:hypothetical protein